MHEGMQYDLIHGQGQGYEPLRGRNPSIFEGAISSRIYNGGWQMTTDS